MTDVAKIEQNLFALRERFHDRANELHKVEREAQRLRNVLQGLDAQITRKAIQIEDIRAQLAKGSVAYLEDQQ